MAESEDIKWMKRALQLAALGSTTTLPNPAVGCVIVDNMGVIAEGWHKACGGPHAEVEAMIQIPEATDLSKATAYVTLEPCSHFGKTPPCVDLLIKRGIGRVVSAMEDPNPQVSGRGHSKLQANGITVSSGVLESEAKHLNRAFIKLQTSTLPYITLKWAESADGFIDPETNATSNRGSIPISSNEVNKQTHNLRAINSAILVGRKTAQIDNPRLTLRSSDGTHPIRLVIDPELQLNPTELKMISEAGKTYFICYKDITVKHDLALPILSKNHDLEEMLQTLRDEYNIYNLLIEGGRFTHQQFIEKNLWDEAWIVKSNSMLHQGLKAPFLSAENSSTKKFGNDSLTIAFNHD